MMVAKVVFAIFSLLFKYFFIVIFYFQVFFVVQPKFMNVDIRVTVDVTQGGLDLYLSPRDDTFVVEVNSSTGAHSVLVDSR